MLYLKVLCFTLFCSNPAVEDPELVDLCEKLWDLDKNRLEPDKDYKLDLQGRTKYSYDGPDRAKDPLFEFVDESVFKRDTYKGLRLYLSFHLSKNSE